MTKKDLEDLVGAYKDQIEFLKARCDELKEEKDKLIEQVGFLQQGLMAVKSPEAYRDYRADTADIPELTEEEIARREELARNAHLVDRFVHGIEGPSFKGPEDMVDLLSRTFITEGPKDESLHGNTES
jgi:hypothetical protein